MPTLPLRLPIARRGEHDLALPAYAKPGDAGLDLRARVQQGRDALVGRLFRWLDARTLRVFAGGRVSIPCGFAFEIPAGYEGQVRSRSGCARNAGLVVELGTIDSSFRGEVAVLVKALGPEYIDVEHGDRIAQLVIAPVARCGPVLVDELGATERGEGGHGHTGKR